MKKVQIIMGTPVIVEIRDEESREELFSEVFDYFKYVDEKFSTYKETSEITAINKKKVSEVDMSDDMKLIFALAKETNELTRGYFNIKTPGGNIDPSGVVKGWSIWNASKLLKKHGVENFYVEAGGDIQTSGANQKNEPWSIGIQNPFNELREVVKKVYLSDLGIATSGNYVRKGHIYNPKDTTDPLSDIVSMTVIGPNVYEADRFATAAFAMGKDGIFFVENLDGFEGYSIDKNKIGTMTSGFSRYTHKTHA